MTQFLDSGKRVYEYTDEQTTIDDNDLGHLDKSGYPRAKKFKFLNVFNYIKTKLGFGSFENKAFHKAYIKSDSSGFELKGNLEDFAPVTENELTQLFVELLNQEDGVLTANKIINIAGLVAQVTRNTSVDNNAPDTSKLFYFNPENNTFATIEKSKLGGSSENFANTNLTFDNNRTHDLAGYKATLDNAEVKIIADADTSGNVPFEVIGSSNLATASLLKIRGDKYIDFGVNTLDSNNPSISFFFGNVETPSLTINGTTPAFLLGTASLGRYFTIYNNYYASLTNITHNQASGGTMKLSSTGTNGVVDLDADYIKLTGIIEYANDAAADADSNLPSGGVYRTVAGGRTLFQKP